MSFLVAPLLALLAGMPWAVEPHPPAPPWDDLAACESNETWDVATGNGYYGGLQFDRRTWEWTGGKGLPSEASREEQIRRAEILLDLRAQAGLDPWAAWPVCSVVVGLRP